MSTEKEKNDNKIWGNEAVTEVHESSQFLLPFFLHCLVTVSPKCWNCTGDVVVSIAAFQMLKFTSQWSCYRWLCHGNTSWSFPHNHEIGIFEFFLFCFFLFVCLEYRQGSFLKIGPLWWSKFLRLKNM